MQYLSVLHNIHTDNKQNFIFTLSPKNSFILYSLLANISLKQIIVQNNSNSTIVIPRGTYVGKLESINPGCSVYYVGASNAATDTALSGPPL